MAVIIKKSAMAGTMESSDVLVTVEPNEGQGIEFELDSVVLHQFGHSIKKTVLETLEQLDVKDVRIHMVDKGALDCTIKARLEGAIYRAAEQKENFPWGGVIK